MVLAAGRSVGRVTGAVRVDRVDRFGSVRRHAGRGSWDEPVAVIEEISSSSRTGAGDDRNAELGSGRGLLPDLPRPLRDERAGSEAGPARAVGRAADDHGFKGGDLLGVVEHLDYLSALGVNAVYFNPVFQSASNHRYHTYDYLTVDPLLGGNAALRELIDECHARGIRVVLDGVFNHASRGFWPFNHVMEIGKASPYRDWFYFNDEFLEAGRQLRAFQEATHGGRGRHIRGR